MANLSKIPHTHKPEEVLKPLFAIENFSKYEKAFHSLLELVDIEKIPIEDGQTLQLFSYAQRAFYKNYLLRIETNPEKKEVLQKYFEESFSHLFSVPDTYDYFIYLENLSLAFDDSMNFGDCKNSLEILSIVRRAYFAKYIQDTTKETTKKQS